MYSLNNKKDILIYDESNFFIKLIKHYFGKNIDLIYCNDKKEFNNLNFNTINVIFINSIETSFDITEIGEIHDNFDEIYVSTDSIKVKKYLMNFNNIYFFDLDEDNYKVMNQIFSKTIAFD